MVYYPSHQSRVQGRVSRAIRGGDKNWNRPDHRMMWLSSGSCATWQKHCKLEFWFTSMSQLYKYFFVNDQVHIFSWRRPDVKHLKLKNIFKIRGQLMTTLNFTSHFAHDAYNLVLYPWLIISNLPAMFVLPVMIDLVISSVLTTRCEKPGWRWTTSNFGLRQLTERERLLGERRRRPFYTISHTYHTHTFKYNFQPCLPYSYLPIYIIPMNTLHRFLKSGCWGSYCNRISFWVHPVL